MHWLVQVEDPGEGHTSRHWEGVEAYDEEQAKALVEIFNERVGKSVHVLQAVGQREPTVIRISPLL